MAVQLAFMLLERGQFVQMVRGGLVSVALEHGAVAVTLRAAFTWRGDMTKTDVTRKLAAILYADVAGYSRLTGADEEGTHRALSASLDLIAAVIEAQGGRVLHYAGDAVLAEFASAVAAVACAADIQRGLAERNADLSDDRKLRFRIGVNLGDVIVDRDELYGDGVNVAARLEALADPGGICVSASVYDAVGSKLPLEYEYLGEQSVKNIARPVRAYRVLSGAAERRGPRDHLKKIGIAYLAVGLVGIVALGFAVFRFVPWAPDAVPEKPVAIARSPVSTGKPTIVVLPFANMSGDANQEYFSDGMTEDLLTDLSKISALTVISRNTAFALKGKSPDIRALGRDLGVSHIVEGSVRKAGGRVRITVQLIDAATGAHIWAERYDRELKDIFALQDEVRGKIVSTLAVKLAADEKKRLALKGTDSVDAYDIFMQGRHRESEFSRVGNAAAIGFYEKAIEIDPEYANAYARLANMYDLKSRIGSNENAERDKSKAVALAEKAVVLDGNNPFTHWTLGRILARFRSGGVKTLLRAVGSLERAIELDPGYADAHAWLSYLYVGIGEPEKAQQSIDTAMKLNPRYPFWYIRNRGIIRYMEGDYAAAAALFEKGVRQNPTANFVRWWLAAAYAQAGRQQDAEWQLEEMKSLGFQGTIKDVMTSDSVIRHPPYVERYMAGLRKAGIPD